MSGEPSRHLSCATRMNSTWRKSVCHFFSPILAGYQFQRTSQDTHGSAQGFSSPFLNILSRSPQDSSLESPISTPWLSLPLWQRQDPLHYEMDPLGEAPGSTTGATTSQYPLPQSTHCLFVSSGLGLKELLQVLDRVFATFVSMDVATQDLVWSIFPPAKAICKLLDIRRKHRKKKKKKRAFCPS